MNQPFLYMIIAVGAAVVVFAVVWAIRDSGKLKKLLVKADIEKDELLSIIADAELMVAELNNFSDYILTRIDEKNAEAGEYLKKLDRAIGTAPEDAGEVPAAGARHEGNVADMKRRRGRYALRAGRRLARGGWHAEDSPPVDEAPAGGAFADVAPVDDAPAGVASADEAPADGMSAEAAPAGTVIQTAAEDAAPPPAQDVEVPAPVAPPPSPLILYSLDRDGERPFRRGRERGFEALVRNNKKYADVISRAEDGMGGGEIARELGIGRGEVELILGLRKA